MGPISPEAALSLTALGVHEDVGSLQGLECFTNLRTLMLYYGGSIVDLSPLTPLIALENLLVSYQPIQDFGPLSDHPTLMEVTATNTKPLDLLPFASMKALRVLRPDDSGIKDLSALSGAPALEELDVINNEITDLAGLEGVSVDYNLEIIDNDKLVDLQGLGAVTGAIDVVKVVGNAGLLALDGPTGLVDAWEVRIEDNPKLKSPGMLSGLKTANLVYITGTNIVDLAGLAALTDVAEYLGIKKNPALTTLTGIENLMTATSLEVNEHPKLTSIAALQNGSLVVKSEFSVAFNPLIPTCVAKAVYDGLQPPPNHYCYANKQDACSGPDSCKPSPDP